MAVSDLGFDFVVTPNAESVPQIKMNIENYDPANDPNVYPECSTMPEEPD